MPLRRHLDDTLTMILDAQGIIHHSVSYKKEEGDIIHCLTNEHIAELFRLNPDEVVVDDSSVLASDLPIPESYDDIDEIILEDLDDEEAVKYTCVEEELPTFTDLFIQHLEDELKHKTEENEGDKEASAEDLQGRKEE